MRYIVEWQASGEVVVDAVDEEDALNAFHDHDDYWRVHGAADDITLVARRDEP